MYGKNINACERTGAALGAYLDQELSVRKRQQVEAHLAQCANCRAELADLHRLNEILHKDEPLPRVTSADRFAAQVILQLKPQLAPRAWERTASILWWLIPIAALGGWVFLHTAFFISSLAVAILESGTLPTWIVDALLQVIPSLASHSSGLSNLPPSLPQILNYLILQLQTLFLVLAPQFLLVLLYWSWLAGWQIFKRRRYPSDPLTYS
jgi:hypothetical protein